MNLKTLSAILMLLTIIGCTSPPETTTSTTLPAMESTTSTTSTTTTSTTTTTIKMVSDALSIASWDVQEFGRDKYNNPEVRNAIIRELGRYDIIALQGIHDPTGKYFQLLMEELPEHGYVLSPELGGIFDREQYAFIHRKGIVLLDHYVFEDEGHLFEREPFIATFMIKDYTFDMVQIHTAQDNAEREIPLLLEIRTSNNQIWLGDLNADCRYYDERQSTKYVWVIKDREDTTATEDSCAYDRIIVTYPIADRVRSHEVNRLEDYSRELQAGISSHYPVSMEVGIPSIDCGNIGFENYIGNLTTPPITANGEKSLCEQELQNGILTIQGSFMEHKDIDLGKRICRFSNSNVTKHGDVFKEGWSLRCSFSCCELKERYRLDKKQ